MLRVRIALVPYGQDDLAGTIGVLLIGNDGTAEGADTGNYDVAYKEGDPENCSATILTEQSWDWTYARVEHFDRALGSLGLIERALGAIRAVRDAEVEEVKSGASRPA